MIQISCHIIDVINLNYQGKEIVLEYSAILYVIS